MPRTAAHTTLQREYLKSLRAAEMAAWNAADRPANRPQAGGSPRSSRFAHAAATLDRALSSPDGAAWIAGALAALIVSTGILIRITESVVRFTSLMGHLVTS